MNTKTDILLDQMKNTAKQIAKDMQEVSILIGEEPKNKNEKVIINGEAILPGLGLTHHAENVRFSSDEVNSGLFKVLVIGDFNSGKSTLLNALAHNSIFPDGYHPTTAAITWLIPSVSESYRVYRFGKAGFEEISRERFKELCFKPKDIDIDCSDKEKSKPRVHTDISRIEVRYPLNHVFKDVALIDTLGFNSDKRDDLNTINALRSSHAVLYVFILNTSIGEKCADFLKQLSVEKKENGEPLLDASQFFLVGTHLDVLRYHPERLETEIIPAARSFLLRVFGKKEVDDIFKNRFVGINAAGAVESRTVPGFKNEEEKSNILILEKKLCDFFEIILEKPMRLISHGQSTLQKAINEAKEKHKVFLELGEKGLDEIARRRNNAEKYLNEAMNKKKKALPGFQVVNLKAN